MIRVMHITCVTLHAASRLSLIWCRQTLVKTKDTILQNVGTAFTLALKETYCGNLALNPRHVRTWIYPEVLGPKL
jgi:hypothetical protein